MEDFIGLIVVFIIYFLAAGSGRKKKKRQRRQKQRPFVQIGQPQRKGAHGQEKPAFYEQERSAAKPAAPAAPAQKNCHDTRSIHLHEVNAWQMEMAGEGEDPCHAGGFEAQSQEEFSPIYADETQTDRRMLAQDVLRGVVMSEILTRPCDRRAMQRNGRMR